MNKFLVVFPNRFYDTGHKDQKRIWEMLIGYSKMPLSFYLDQ